MTTPTIKFRGVRKDNGEEVFGDLITDFFRNSPFIVQQGKILPVHPDSVAQYTCMNDENGKEIYGSVYPDGKLTKGGDIYFVSDKYRNEFNRNTYFVIVYDDAGFWSEVRKSDTESLGNRNGSYKIGTKYPIHKNIEVLGSLFKNPDLLK